MQERHLCWRPYFFLGPAVAPTFFILESPLSVPHLCYCGAEKGSRTEVPIEADLTTQPLAAKIPKKFICVR